MTQLFRTQPTAEDMLAAWEPFPSAHNLPPKWMDELAVRLSETAATKAGRPEDEAFVTALWRAYCTGFRIGALAEQQEWDTTFIPVPAHELPDTQEA